MTREHFGLTTSLTSFYQAPKVARYLRQSVAIACLGVVTFGTAATAQTFGFGSVNVDGNQRIETSTILTYLGLVDGGSISAAALNDGYQRMVQSGLFESVEIVPNGSRLDVVVVEYPTVNRVVIEGNSSLKDDGLLPILTSQSRRAYNPSTVEADAEIIRTAYQQKGLLTAEVEPKLIRRSNNRVDVVFEVSEGRNTEVERIGFVGNRTYSDRRLRRVLDTKQAGFLRAIVGRDTFSEDRIAFDRQVLADFYQSRGFVDFQILSSTPELSRERDGFFVTFNVQEGQSFDFGEITVVSEIDDIDADEYKKALQLRSGSTYNPAVIDSNISRLEALATKQNKQFVRIEPRVVRNDADLTLDIEFVISRGERVFVERIDIEGNNTTLDRVIRRQFNTVEGDPFNPTAIRAASTRVRALGFFANADVNTREGSSPDQVIVDVDVTETTTGSFSFGGNYSSDDGFGLVGSFNQSNFLGRGQRLSFSINTSADSRAASLTFREPAFLGRNVAFGLALSYGTTTNSTSGYDVETLSISPSLTFPLGENARLAVNYAYSDVTLSDVDEDDSSPILFAEEGQIASSSVGYNYSFDNRRSGLNPTAGLVFEFGQNYTGFTGDVEFIETTARLGAQTSILNEEVTLRAELEGGALNLLDGSTRVTDRYSLNSSKLRGFAAGGVGPRDINATNEDFLGGKFFAVARLDAEFPFGLPEEYGLSGGVFADFGAVWGLDDVSGTGGSIVDDDFHLRSAIGVSVFWDTALGPLRFNFSKALMKEDYDVERPFDVTISTNF